jgi:putative molybdopterin biosynthesis protein
MKIIPTLGWRLAGDSGEAIDARLIPLLDAIATQASLAAAVIACGVSYRAAWGLLRDYERKFGAPLVQLERGRGASLTALGTRWLEAQAAANERMGRLVPSLAFDIEPATRPDERPRIPRLRVAASHDLALAWLSQSLPELARVALELSVTGSLPALREFAEGRADIAGFHVPVGKHAGWDRAPFLEWLNARRDKLIRFVDREQGLILPRGNPARVRSLRDVAARNLRFVNRQRGSATRLLIDRMIADERIDASSLDGFGKEEFTHPAVAATVASGGADAGFGVHAAAAEYGLAFVPLVRERYYLAVRAKDVVKPPFVHLIGALRGQVFTHVRRLPGYFTAGAGTISGLEALKTERETKSRRR